MSNLLGPRDANGIPVPMTVDESIASMKASLLKKIKRSAYVYRVDCGGCNGCEIEIFATLSPLFDAERFGIKVVPSPRHADILLFTGAVTRAMRSPALRAWQSAPDPKICISYGACGNSGGIFHDLYCVWGGTDKIVPVDVYIPGCPPRPEAILYGMMQLQRKVKVEKFFGGANHKMSQDEKELSMSKGGLRGLSNENLSDSEKLGHKEPIIVTEVPEDFDPQKGLTD